MERFSEVKNIDRSNIVVDPRRFQGRQSEFSEDSVQSIVNKGAYDRSGEPIVVWYDVALDKYIVISGHSRFEATRRLYEKGDKSLQTIPVKEFIGDMDEAMDYAILESNRGGTEEGIVSDVMAYRRAVESGKSKDFIKGVFKPESKLHKLQKLYFLNPKGEFIEWLGKESSQSFPYLERNAQWVGEIRSFLPQLSDLHEREIFDFIYKSGNKKALEMSKSDFYNKIEKRVNRIDFNPDEPLNLESHVSSSAYADPLVEQIKELDSTIEKSKKEVDRLRENIVRARNERKQELIPDFQKKIANLDSFIISKIQEREDLRQKIGKLERTLTVDLFSEPEPQPEPIKPVTIIEPPKAKDQYIESEKKLSKRDRLSLNKQISEFIKNKDANNENYTLADVEFIQQYTGNGGLGEVLEKTNQGMLYEYYTPLPIVKKMWELVFDNGFTNGKILEPSCGIGRFFRFIDPAVNTVDAYEFTEEENTSFRIAQISFPFVNITNDYFESIFYDGNKRVGKANEYDLVIGNPPYDKFDGYYSGKKREGKVTNATTYANYFLWAAIELLKPNGLVCFIIPSSFLDNNSTFDKFKDELFEKAELVDAYRVPKTTFIHTEIQTDIVLFRKK